jgi:hypothetical protein
MNLYIFIITLSFVLLFIIYYTYPSISIYEYFKPKPLKIPPAKPLKPLKIPPPKPLPGLCKFINKIDPKGKVIKVSSCNKPSSNSSSSDTATVAAAAGAVAAGAAAAGSVTDPTISDVTKTTAPLDKTFDPVCNPPMLAAAANEKITIIQNAIKVQSKQLDNLEKYVSDLESRYRIYFLMGDVSRYDSVSEYNNPTIKITGSLQEPILNLTLLQPRPGDDGQQGKKGPDGPRGDPGISGTVGIQGYWGDAGKK